MRSPCMSPWLCCERLVGVLQHSGPPGCSEVWWRETLCGRHFEVMVRVAPGPAVSLTLVEYPRRRRAITAAVIVLLAKKAARVQAHEVAMVAAAGYHAGCHAVAERHRIRLLTVGEVAGTLEDLIGGSPEEHT